MPRDVSLQHTLAFVTESLPRTRRRLRILDVGCGDGLLASALIRLGHVVVPIDSAPQAVEAARHRGVQAIHADLLTFEDEPFDVALFARSLHHIHPLASACDQALDLLRPGGRIILEEFSLEAMNEGTAAWFYDTLDLLSESGLISRPRAWLQKGEGQPKRALTECTGGGVARLEQPLRSRPGQPLARWNHWHRHEHALSTGAQMVRALKRRFADVQTWSGPFLFRYACEMLTETAPAVAVAHWLLDRETLRIEQGLIRPIGLRVTARKGPRTRRD